MVKISLIMGPMFAGKTELLVRQYEEKKAFALGRGEPNGTCLLVKSRADARLPGKHDIHLHGGAARSARADIVAETVAEINQCRAGAKHIYIDEGQFFTDIDQVSAILADLDTVTIALLNGDFRHLPFNAAVSNIIPHAFSVTLLRATCSVCQRREAIYSVRIDDENCEKIVIGGHSLYKAVCPSCMSL